MKRIILYSALMIIVLPFNSCRKFLDEKSRDKLAIPTTIRDAQALLDNYQLQVLTRPFLNSVSDDDYYLTDTYYNSLTTQMQELYRWDKNATYFNDWRFLYQNVLAANTAIETIDQIQPAQTELQSWNRVKGSAHFIRAYNLMDAVQLYANVYSKDNLKLPGIPLRLTGSINEKINRSTIEESYRQIENDLKTAARFLPITNPPPSRPSLPAAFGALSRLYLIMGDYEKAASFADSCLRLYNTLMDYNTINTTILTPFSRFNAEVIFQSCLSSNSINNVNNWRVDSLLYKLYANNDLRKQVFYHSNGINTYGFKGSYDGNASNAHFSGIASDEIYLIRAEALARLGMKDSALAYLNNLLVKRWKSGSYVPFTASSAEEALKIVLTERRKELVCRGIRWYDLKRLNTDPRFAKTLERKINGQVYQLFPGDSRYVQFIPFEVIAFNGMEQNKR